MKLQYYGVQGVMLNWFKSNLQHRRQRVELKYINDKYYSSWAIVKCGVPQGSVLGPLLFNIYINDFPLEINKISKIIMYADDTNILITTKNYQDLKLKLDKVLCHVFKWFQNNKFVLNIDKTNKIKFTPTAATRYRLNLTFSDKSLLEVEMIKFLGLQLDNHLTCKRHIDLLLYKLSTVCFIMRKLYYTLNINDLKTVYFAYYHSLVKSGIIYWGNVSGTNKVFVLKKKIIRITMGVGPSHTRRGLFKKLNILLIPRACMCVCLRGCTYIH
jgi:hypothetical protein